MNEGILYKLTEALNAKEEGLVHADGGAKEFQLKLAGDVFEAEGITDVDEMLKLIMTASKGWANPKMVKEFLDNRFGGS